MPERVKIIRLLLVGALFCPNAAAAQEIIYLGTRPGVTQTFLVDKLPQNVRAIAILFPGSGGFIRIRKEEQQIKFGEDNFLVRSRSEFVKRGVVVAVVDAPSDQQRHWGMSDEFRLGVAHFADMAAVVDVLGGRFSDIPVFLVGTSRGSVSAAALAARFGRKIAGAVLTSSMFRPAGPKSSDPGPGLSRFDFSSIKARTLIVHHVSDRCASTPYSGAARLSDQFPLITVFGGNAPQSDPCDPFGAHGFFGREAETIEQIVNWMLKRDYLEEIK